MMILSGDRPRSRVLSIILVAILLALAFAPFLFPGSKPLNVAAKICIFALLVASYDLLLGYTGIVSFAHTMFFGIGSYGIALALYNYGASWSMIALGIAIALPLAALLALAIGLFSLRVQAIFFSMVTLAVASAFAVLASQLSWLTGGEDGRSFQVPPVLRPGNRLFDGEILGVSFNGRVVSYYLVFLACVAAVSPAFAHRQFAVRARAAGDPRKSVPGRSARLPHRRASHARQRHRGADRRLPPARSMRSGCITPGRRRASASRSCWTFSSWSSSAAWARCMAP